MKPLPVLLLALFATVSTQVLAQKWSFVVAGDGRSDGKVVRPEDKNGVNVTITGEIAQAVIKEKAKFLAWTGDLAMGYQKDPAAFESQLMTWRETMKPLYDKHIPVLPTRGNHDASSTDADTVWRKVFSGPYSLPLNGPTGEDDLTFFFGKGDVLLLGLDQYGTRKETVNQGWIDKVLNDYKKPFIFAMGHEPAFMDGSHKDTMDVDAGARDVFWESLIKAGSRVFFCGHDHLYDHMVVTRKGSDPGPKMHQLVAGTAGAPFYPKGDYTGNNTYWNLDRVAHIGNTYGYLLVQIDGNKCTVTFKGRKSPGVYVPMDSFSFTSPNSRKAKQVHRK